MKKTIPVWQMAGFVFTGILGTFLHFLFDITNGNVIAAIFSAVNESIWEHMKLLYYPMLIFTAVQYRFWGKEKESFWCIKLIGMLLGLCLIPVIYYTYTGILGKSADWFKITIFFIAAATSYWVETRLFQRGFTCRLNDKFAAILLFLISAAFTALTFWPPHIPFFQDPITGTYGFQISKPS